MVLNILYNYEMIGPELIILGVVGGFGCIAIVEFTKKWCQKDSCTAVMWGVLAIFIILCAGFAASGFF